jgi:hypothetical protein
MSRATRIEFPGALYHAMGRAIGGTQAFPLEIRSSGREFGSVLSGRCREDPASSDSPREGGDRAGVRASKLTFQIRPHHSPDPSLIPVLSGRTLNQVLNETRRQRDRAVHPASTFLDH